MTRKLAILGSTGSIGTQALDVCEKANIEITALTAYSRIDLIEQQIRKFRPKIAAVADEDAAKALRQRVSDTDTVVYSGAQGIAACACESECDTVLNAIVGMAGLEPTLLAIEAKKTIALANKETLVAGGRLVTESAAKNGVSLLPVDSEHSAVFQCLEGMNKKSELSKIILTASGGPFFGKTKDELRDVTVSDALKHPNWSMGAKITVDSATMMNKGLELIEAVWLFGVSADEIDIVVHRESVIHSMIEYVDGSVIAQLGVPDMRIPIQYALTYPARVCSPVRRLSLVDYGSLTFYRPDYDTFRCIDLCREAISLGGLYPAVVNGANEQANELFRNGKIGFLQVAQVVEKAMNSLGSRADYSLSDVLQADAQARKFVMKECSR